MVTTLQLYQLVTYQTRFVVTSDNVSVLDVVSANKKSWQHKQLLLKLRRCLHNGITRRNQTPSHHFEKSMLAMDEKEIYFRSGHSRKQNFSKTSC